MAAFCIACNHCSKQLDATAIRTACNHLFCLVCATEHFSNGCTCPTCHSTLSSKHIGEVIIGIPPMSVKQCMFQLVLQNSEWEHIVTAVEHIRQASDEVSAFIQKQLLLAGSSDYQRRSSLVSQLEESKAELSKTIAKARSQAMISDQHAHELHHQCTTREKELGDLKDAYKEKKRQCDAWEKVYKKLKAEVESGQGQSQGQLQMYQPSMQPGSGQLGDVSAISYNAGRNSNSNSNSNNSSNSSSFNDSSASMGSDPNSSFGEDRRSSGSRQFVPNARVPFSTTTTMTTTDSSMVVHNKRPYASIPPPLSTMNLNEHNSYGHHHQAYPGGARSEKSIGHPQLIAPAAQRSQSHGGNTGGEFIDQNSAPTTSVSSFAGFRNNNARLNSAPSASGQASRFFDKVQ